MKLEQDLEAYLSQLDIPRGHPRLAVACSAGVDSLVLLSALQKFSSNLFCLHLDHSLREDSHLAREFLEDYCQTHKLNFIGRKLRVGDLKMNEESARDARYEFFRETCLQAGITDLFLAHNLNDQAETILFRIFRGTNTAGLQGMPQFRELSPGLRIHRPLLKTSRQIIEKYASSNNLKYIEDSSNEDLKYSRNRIRKCILPEAEIINPQYLNNIQALSGLIVEEQEFFQNCVDAASKQLGDLPWSLVTFRTFQRSIQRKLIEKSFIPNISFVNDFLKAVEEGGFHRINFSKDKYFTIKQKQIHLETSAKIASNGSDYL